MIFIIVTSVILLDQLTKFFALRFLQLNTPVPLIKNFLNLTLVNNRGAAFGFFQNHNHTNSNSGKGEQRQERDADDAE